MKNSYIPVFIPVTIFGKVYSLLYQFVPTRRFKEYFELTVGIFARNKGILFKEMKTGILFNLKFGDEFTRKMLLDKAYEPYSVHLAMQIMSTQGGIFIDIGANFGLYTCLVSSIPNVKTIAIESYHEAFSSLIKHIRRNKLSNVDCYLGCVSSETKVVIFSEPSIGNSGIGQVVNSITNKEYYFTGQFNINQVLKTLVSNNVRLIKIDIEFGEIEILNKILFDGEFIPNHIIIEFNKIGSTEAISLFNLVIGNGYKAYTVKGQPITEIPTSMPYECNLWFSRSDL